MKNSIAKDTIFLTVMQLVTQVLSLVINIFINNRLGTENLGLMSLINAFFTFAIIISNGNIFVSASRFVAEERGKTDGNPGKIFFYSIIFSLILSSLSAAVVFISARPVSVRILHSAVCQKPIRMLAFALPAAAVSSCIKGYFNAYRKVVIPTVSETAAFLVRSFIMMISAGILIPQNRITIYTALSVSIITSEFTSLCILLFSLSKNHPEFNKNKTIGFPAYAAGLIPVMLNSYIPCILSTANDALVPYTLKQTGCSTALALSRYGLFEAVVLPVLFFPSMFISCLSTILVPEISKQRAGGSKVQNIGLVNDVISATIIYSLYIVSIMSRFGNDIGILAGHDAYAGKMIAMLAPVVPFIYLEIILEGIIKGLGKHTFSSLNYLAEYIIRISSLLISTHFAGCWGIAVSYYLSNIICNIARIVLISKIYDIRPSFRQFLLKPSIAVIVSWQCTSAAGNIADLKYPGIIPEIIIYSAVSLIIYLAVLRFLDSPVSLWKMPALSNNH